MLLNNLFTFCITNFHSLIQLFSPRRKISTTSRAASLKARPKVEFLRKYQSKVREPLRVTSHLKSLTPISSEILCGSIWSQFNNATPQLIYSIRDVYRSWVPLKILWFHHQATDLILIKKSFVLLSPVLCFQFSFCFLESFCMISDFVWDSLECCLRL